MTRKQELDKLLSERNEIEAKALEWGDRWLAANPYVGFAAVRPITFDRAVLAEHFFFHGTGRLRDTGLSHDRCRIMAGLKPLNVS